MSNYVNDTEMKSRKEHKCCACGEIIPKGFRYIKSFQVWEGDANTSKWHTECRNEFGEMLHRWGDDEGDPYDTWEDGLPAEIRMKYGIPLDPEEESLEQWKDNENKKGYV